MLSVRQLMRSFSFIKLFVLALLIHACRPSIPVGIMSESHLEDILYDYTIAIAMSENAPLSEGQDRDMLRYQYVQKVFEKYDITEAEFDSTMVWYSSEGKRLSKVFERLNKRVDAEAKSIGVDMSEMEIYANYTMDGDTANVWSGSHIVYQNNYQPDNLSIISIPADSTYLPGDSYKLAFSSHFLPANQSHSIYVLFSVYYEDNSVLSQTQLVGGDYKTELNLVPRPGQDNLKPNRLVITLYSPPVEPDHIPQVFYMTYPSVLRIHHKKAEEKKDMDDMQVADSLASADTLHVVPDTMRRLTPLEERDNREERHEIRIVKERIQPAAPVRRGVTRRRRI